jgi:hypothetical protein
MWFGLVLLLAQPVASPRPVPRPGLSWDEADSLTGKLDALERRPRATKAESVVVTEGELNSYLNLAQKMPPGVTDVDVHFDRDRIDATAQVDIDQMKRKMPAQGPLNPLSLLGGRLPVFLKGRFVNRENGFGSVEVEEVRVGPLALPTTLVAQWIAATTRTAHDPQGFDVAAPFRLPYALKRVRLQPGRAFLDF